MSSLINAAADDHPSLRIVWNTSIICSLAVQCVFSIVPCTFFFVLHFLCDFFVRNRIVGDTKYYCWLIVFSQQCISISTADVVPIYIKLNYLSNQHCLFRKKVKHGKVMMQTMS